MKDLFCGNNQEINEIDPVKDKMSDDGVRFSQQVK